MADITGTSGNDTLNGTTDADTINPLLGRDSADGLDGSDTLIVDYSSAAVDPYAGASVANVPSEVSSTGGTFHGAIKTVDGGNYVTFSNIEHLQVTLDFFHNIFRLDGSALTQGASLTVDGGAGNDTLDLNLSALASVDLQTGPGGITASFGTIISFETFRLELTGAADNVTTGSGHDTLAGNGGDDVLDSAGGQDVLSGGTGTNSLTAGDGDDRITSAGSDTVDGGAGYDRWIGNYGSSGANLTFLHDSGTGAGTLSNGTILSDIEQVEFLTTGSGNDVFTFTAGGANSVSAGAGEDTLNLTGSGWSGTIQADGSAAFRGALGYDQFSGMEHLNFVSNDGDDSIVVAAAPLLAGATLSLDAAGGDDTLAMDFTGFGGISFVVSGGTVTTSVAATLSNFENYHIISGSGADTITTGNGDDIVEGKGGVDVIRTAGGNDRLNGGVGADQMEGGLGNDRYVIDAADVLIEAASAGIDHVEAAFTYALVANFENLTLTGIAAVNGTGNALANSLTGNSAANILNGGAGADTMTGGLGNDSYVVDNVLDQAIETVGPGTDKVTSSVSFTLGDNVESLILAGTAAINGTGNGLANVILGNDGANVLNGGFGADNMQGGLGNDSYVVDNALDKVTETSASGGTDRVTSSVGFALGTNIEQLILTGTGAINGTGNGLANAITGNDGANVLNGGAGADTMTGGLGNDAYAVDNALDKVIETSAAGGTDRVSSSVSFTLGNNVENLTLTGSAAINGTGNTLANTILGNGAANVLNGAAGADTMQGGLGNDTYVVDNVLDKATETSTSVGTDLVRSSVSFSLTAYVENLTLLGSAVIDGTGNNGANTLAGNTAANILKGLNGNDVIDGGAGNDQIHGGAGNDSLKGGTGADGFVFNSLLSATTNVDHILDFVHAIDEIQLENAVFTTLAAGALSASAFRLGTAALDADDRILYDAASGALSYDKDGTGAAAAVQFATLDNMPATLNATDFLVI